jgi:hypothetical protein
MKRWMLWSFLGVVAMTLAPAASYAQCNRRFTSCGTPYVAPVIKTVVPVVEVVTPIAVPVIVPAFTFQYSPPCPCPQVPVQAGGYTVAAPGVGYPGVAPGVGYPGVGYPGGYGATGYMQPGYGSPPAAYGQPGLPQQPPQQHAAIPSSKDKIRELAKALLEEMQKQSESSDDDGPPVAPNGVNAYPPAQSSQQPVGQQPPSGNNFFAPEQPRGFNQQHPQAQLAFASLQRNCAACHTGVGAKGDVIIFSQPGLLNPSAPWSEMARAINTGHMPPRQSQYVVQPQEKAAMLAVFR